MPWRNQAADTTGEETCLVLANRCGSFDRKPKQRGYVSLLAAISIVTLAAFAGLAVDSGYMEVIRRRAQTAADSAALAAVFEMQRGERGANLLTAARGDAALNGFVD